MKRPAFQFYPGDWRSNANLRRCTHKERGIWLDVLCLMHDSEEYGVLRWPLCEVAEAVGCKEAELRALATKAVLKGCDAGKRVEPYSFTPRHAGKDGETVVLVPDQDGPIWYSSRMVKDEYVRSKRGEGTRFGDDQRAHQATTPKAAPIPPIGDGPSSSSSSSLKEKEGGHRPAENPKTSALRISAPTCCSCTRKATEVVQGAGYCAAHAKDEREFLASRGRAVA